MKNIFDFTKDELCEFIQNNNFKKFTTNQIIDWVYQKNELNVDNFCNIKKDTKDFIKNNISFELIKIIHVEEDDLVKKFLFLLPDGEKVEAVLMYHDYGLSICVSSQVGCNMGCKFCESGRLKKIRNLETFEIVEQIILVQNYVHKKIDSVVIMGIGEPFDNYDNVIKFIKIINDDKMLAIGARHITVSTCGLIPKILEFANIGIQVNLAISLHAPDNDIRKKIMPIAKVYDLESLIDTVKKYIDITGRRVTMEYVMLKGINDSKECAIKLAKLLNNMNVYVNLIPYNETKNIEFIASNKNDIDIFYKTLKENNINVTVRRKFGNKISAACGQLRSKDV